MPAPPSAPEFCALLDTAARARGTAHGVDFRRYSSCRALLAALHSLARKRERGRPVSGTVRSSWGYLAKLVGELLAWERDRDHYANGDRRRSSLRRWLRELEAAGLLRVAIVVDDEGQERGLDVELRPVPPLPAVALERAAERLVRWRRRYGDGPELAARRSGAILARLEARRRGAAARFPARRSHSRNTSGPPLSGAFGNVSKTSNQSDPWSRSCGARERAQSTKRTRPTTPFIVNAASASSAGTTGTENEGREVAWRAQWARWEGQIAAADAVCEAFAATPEAPLPRLEILRLALAGRCQGVAALAAGEPMAGLGPRLVRRLQRAATSWMRWRPTEAPDAAGELLARAESEVGAQLGEVVRGFVVAAHRQASRGRALQSERLSAAHRRAARHRAELLAAWPAWLARDGNRLALDAGDRFLQVRWLPSSAELSDPELRRWLRAMTALQWFAPAAAVELTDPDGRYAYVPLDASRLQLEGERTRGPWISEQPKRRQAIERARRAIAARKSRRRGS